MTDDTRSAATPNAGRAWFWLEMQAAVLLLLSGVLAGCGGLAAPPALTSIAVGPPDAGLAKGLTRQFTATGIYSDGTKRQLTSVTWSTANPAVATISADNGIATAVNAGVTRISAAVGTLSGTTTLNVTAAVLVSIGVTPAHLSLPAGLPQPFTATGIYSDNSTQNLTSAVTWTASSPGVATISNAAASKGVATTVKSGSTAITATLGDVFGTTPLTVDTATLSSIDITPLNLSVAAGLQHQFAASGVYSDNSTHDLTNLVLWSSSSNNIATISNAAGSIGLATTLKPGTTTLTAALGDVSGTAPLTVTAATLVAIGVTPVSAGVAAGLKDQFTATAVYTDHSTHDITAGVVWSSSAPSVATISNAAGFDGLATTHIPGSTMITAAQGGVTGSAALTVTAATLASIAVTPATGSLAIGTSLQYVATGTFTDHSTQVLTSSVAWTSSVPSVAVLSNASGSQGLATALSQGATTVTAALGAVSGSAPLNVTAATLVSMGVTPASASIAGGTDQQFTAIGIFTDNSTQDLTTQVAWSSSVTSVAGISNAPGSNGLATALGAGSTTITAAFGGVSASTTLTVTTASLVSIALTPVNPSIAVDTSQQFTATGTFSDNSTQDLTTSVTWTSSAPAVAVISNAPGFNGSTTALTPGSTSVAATLNGVSASTTLTVTAATLVSIAVTPATPSIPAGTHQQFTASGTFSDNATQDLTMAVTWSSSAPSIASVSNAPGSVGLANSLGSGSTTITATLGGVSGSTTLTVLSATLMSIAVTPLNATIAYGSDRQFAATGTYSDDSTQNITASVTWISSLPAVASISNAANSNGLATAASLGTTSVTAALGSTTSAPVPLTVSTLAQYAYVANGGDGTVSQYAFGAGGALAALSAPIVPTGNDPEAVAVDPTYRYAYVANSGDGTVSQFTIGAGGALTAMSTPSVAAGNEPQSITVDPTGHYLYVANNGDNTVSQFTIGTGGALTAMSTPTVATGSGPAALVADPTGRYVYVANEAGTVSQFAIGAGGALTPLNPASVPAGSLPQSVVVDPTGRYVYVVNSGDNTVSQFTVGAAGTLSAVSPASIATGILPQSVVVDPTGRYVYVANNTDGTISQYTIGAGGALTAMNPATVQAGSGPQSVTVDQSGRYVYVANAGDDTISQFTLGANGTLPATSTATVATGAGPDSVVTAY